MVCDTLHCREDRNYHLCCCKISLYLDYTKMGKIKIIALIFVIVKLGDWERSELPFQEKLECAIKPVLSWHLIRLVWPDLGL